MKIGIVTFVHAYNYGAKLQCFALQRWLRNKGYDVSVLDIYRPSDSEYIHRDDDGRFLPIFSYENATDNDKKIKRHIVLSKIIGDFIRVPLFWRYIKRHRAFSQFHQKHTSLSSEKYTNFHQLYERPLEYTHLICGSDQIWNYTLPFSSEPYFLTFANKDVKKIAYAASIGHSDIPDVISEKYHQWLEGFSSVSLREKQGVDLIKKITSRDDIVNVLDPVFLLTKNDWVTSLKIDRASKNKRKYVLVYLLSYSPFAIKIAKEVAKAINADVKLITTGIYNPYPFKKIKAIFGASPKEFVSLFTDASFVITNSFHGTSFAINFNIPFFSVTRESKRYNSRFISLLSNTGLISRLLYEESSELDVNSCMQVDFSESNSYLEKQRFVSETFLTNSLR